MEDSQNDDARPVRFATRQPILAADETVIGYKLLFRTDVVSHFSLHGEKGAARRTIRTPTLGWVPEGSPPCVLATDSVNGSCRRNRPGLLHGQVRTER